MKRPDALFSASAETNVRRKNLGEGDPPDPLKNKRSTWHPQNQNLAPGDPPDTLESYFSAPALTLEI